MKKKEKLSVDIPTIEEIENEQKRLRHRAVYQRTLRGTIAVLLVVAAISVLVATLWMPVLQIYGSSMSPTLEAGQIVVSVKTNQLKTGEVVAFWQGNKLLVKRVIAGPGQWVDIDMDGNVTVDGKELTEDYLDVKALGNCDVDLPHQVEESRWFLIKDTNLTKENGYSTTSSNESQKVTYTIVANSRGQKLLTAEGEKLTLVDALGEYLSFDGESLKANPIVI